MCWDLPGLGAKRACLYHPIYYLISVSHISVHNEAPRVSILNILAAGTAFTNYENVKTNKTNRLQTAGIFGVDVTQGVVLPPLELRAIYQKNHILKHLKLHLNTL